MRFLMMVFAWVLAWCAASVTVATCWVLKGDRQRADTHPMPPLIDRHRPELQRSIPRGAQIGQIHFRVVCACGAASPWASTAGMGHGWHATHRYGVAGWADGDHHTRPVGRPSGHPGDHRPGA